MNDFDESHVIGMLDSILNKETGGHSQINSDDRMVIIIRINVLDNSKTKVICVGRKCGV